MTTISLREKEGPFQSLILIKRATGALGEVVGTSRQPRGLETGIGELPRPHPQCAYVSKSQLKVHIYPYRLFGGGQKVLYWELNPDLTFTKKELHLQPRLALNFEFSWGN